jgi:hypothetical protein
MVRIILEHIMRSDWRAGLLPWRGVDIHAVLLKAITHWQNVNEMTA